MYAFEFPGIKDLDIGQFVTLVVSRDCLYIDNYGPVLEHALDLFQYSRRGSTISLAGNIGAIQEMHFVLSTIPNPHADIPDYIKRVGHLALKFRYEHIIGVF